MEHIRRARALTHPFQRFVEDVAGSLKDAISHTIKLGEGINEWRRRQFKSIEQLAERLMPAQKKTVEEAHAEARPRVRGFHVPLFRELLRRFNYDDPGAAELLLEAPILGEFDGPSEWERVGAEVHKERLWTRDEILQSSEEERGSFLRSIGPSDHDEELLRASLSDVQSGRMVGPFFSISDVHKRLRTSRVAISRRFGVKQPDKLRPCDNMRRSRVNRGMRARRRLRLSTLDTFARTWRFTKQEGRRRRKVNVVLKLWKQDHEGAYRQFPLAKRDIPFGVVAF